MSPLHRPARPSLHREPDGTTAMVAGRPGEHLTLLPGQWHVGRHAAQLRTLLGSCVSIVLWHPRQRLGAMCHYLLPSRRRTPGMALEGRFGDEAVTLMAHALQRHGIAPQEFEAHLYGGADTMPDTAGAKFNVGERNIEAGWALIEQHGFTLHEVDVGDNIPRAVTLCLRSGQVQVRRGGQRAAKE
ncbi:chemotaxis protein CheD [Aquabacterium sp. OR-4]|uniref:chemotaxis protein CheD n=1 Tax=Aquabacterium sp. OR-4 TaxID=2978127 RepID=UPI0021B3CF8C|nr:chemotaxis protein CheD [Aquabacterium sp. OR-4]MDT7835396.1 chemotaxis protein CheD [Aquabacterium sp. OR-4]